MIGFSVGINSSILLSHYHRVFYHSYLVTLTYIYSKVTLIGRLGKIQGNSNDYHLEIIGRFQELYQ